MSEVAERIDAIQEIMNEFNIEVEVGGIRIDDYRIDIKLIKGPSVEVEYQRETIFISGKGRLTYVEFFDLGEEDCSYLGLDVNTFYHTVQPAIGKVIVFAENMHKKPKPEQPRSYAQSLLRPCIVGEETPAFFHAFSMEYDEYETGPGNFAVAIIEHTDGSVKTVAADLIKFTDSI